MSAPRPGSTPCWPDRSALRRRRLAKRAFWGAAVLVLVLPWFGYRQVREWLRPEAGAPSTRVLAGPSDAPRPDDGQTAREAVAPLVAAPADGAGAVHAAQAGHQGARVHREVLLADRGSAIRREAARRDVSGIAGVRAAGWVDRMTMLMVMSSRGGGHPTIAEACRRLATHGDVTGLAVRVQEVAGDEVAAGALQGECRQGVYASRPQDPMLPFPGTPLRAGDGTSALADAGPEDAEAAEARRRRAEESLRILSESTPELPAAPQPRADPDAR